MMTFEGSIEDYERNFANFKERGYNEHAAQAMAVESLESEEPPSRKYQICPHIWLTFNIIKG